jgi:hypothetical protein
MLGFLARPAMSEWLLRTVMSHRRPMSIRMGGLPI